MAKTILYTDNTSTNTTSTLTPEAIMRMMFNFRDTAHKFHLNCFIVGVGSHAEHIALDGLYKGIQDLQDTILEEIIGYIQRPINEQNTALNTPKYTSTNDSIRLATAIMDFSKELISFAKSNDMPNIENVAQELSGLAAHTRYFLLFK